MIEQSWYNNNKALKILGLEVAVSEIHRRVLMVEAQSFCVNNSDKK